jgi:hypothetical protein
MYPLYLAASVFLTTPPVIISQVQTQSFTVTEPEISQKAEDLLPIKSQNPRLNSSNTTQIIPPVKPEKLTQVSPSSIRPNGGTERDSLNSNYKYPPRVVKKERVPPNLTALPLNDVPITHLTQWQLNAGVEFGLQRSINLPIEGLFTLNSKVKQSLTQDNVFTSEQSGQYLQLKTVLDQRVLSVTNADPVTVNGFQLQQTFTGSCGQLNPTATVGSQCSLLPGLVIDRNSIDPLTLTPTQIQRGGDLGEVISSETLSRLAQPGFQNSMADDKAVGLDLYIPNTGKTYGNANSDRSKIERYEDVDYTRTLGFYRVNQVYRANDKKAVLGRTIHGFTGILLDRNLSVNLGTQAVAQFLPNIKPRLKGSSKPANSSVNRNLILSANNLRLPTNSFVMYQVGLGQAKHRKPASKKSAIASFNSIWVGLSPIYTREITESTALANIGAEEIINAAGGEGGTQSNIDFTSMLDLGSQVQTINSSSLQDFYSQVYLTFFKRNADFLTASVTKEQVVYRPHISISGNITGDSNLWRYYGGVIGFKNPIAYLGTDFTHDFPHDLRFSAGIIGYLNGDRDYYSKAEAKLAKTFHFGQKVDLSTSASFRYALARPPENTNDRVLNNPIDNFAALGLRARLGPASLGVTQFFEVFPSSVPTSTGLDLSIKIGKLGNLTGFFSPQRGLTNYGAIAQFNLGKHPNSPRLGLSWTHTLFNFGVDAGGTPLGTTDDRFMMTFQIGGPRNPYTSGHPVP